MAEVVAKVHRALDEAQLALESQEQLIEDLRADDVGRSQGAVDPPPSEEALAARRALALLTARERQILVLISQGNSNRCVAKELGISEKTVKNHLTAIFTKVGASDRTQAVVMGIRSGIVSIGEPFNDASGPIGANE
ncbi:response regulator transcription factor [Streptomyces sp. SM1]|uniref:response regulator transcription factor n=1 Tax=Streptomyces sp. SM1 TaxID=402229 RepID=UPI0021563D77|nr:LuxR C-terminal-related transcriptional regulator [Streptomyces sp. SM1]